MSLWRILLKARAQPDASLTCDEFIAVLDYLADQATREGVLRACADTAPLTGRTWVSLAYTPNTGRVLVEAAADRANTQFAACARAQYTAMAEAQKIPHGNVPVTFTFTIGE